MKERIAYIKSAGGRSVAHFSELTDGRMRILSDVSEAVRTIPAAGRPLIFLYEQAGRDHDLTNLSLLRSSFPSCAIILLTTGLDPYERREYLKAGVNSGIRPSADREEFGRTVRFLENYAFRYKPVSTRSETFVYRTPLWKRSFDVVASGAALLLLSPLLLATVVAIKADSPGPVIYRSKRVGSNYRVFDFLKFRSMRTDADRKLRKYAAQLNQYAVDRSETGEGEIRIPLAEKQLEQMLPEMEDGMLISDDFIVSEQEHLQQVGEEQEKAFVKIENDPRVTRVGRFIRKYSIDELPQLINIFKGDMSVVGNRPLPLYEAEHLTSDEYIERFACPSGLTGLWQVEKRGSAGRLSPEERKMLDIRYARTMSPWLDLKILLRTFTAFIQKENV